MKVNKKVNNKNNKKRRLLFSVTKKDLVIEFFRSSGPGGQRKNKTKSACRIKHPDSGAIGMCQEHKSPEQNKKQAFVRMATSFIFKRWKSIKTQEMLSEKTIEQEIEELMLPENISIEIFDKNNKKWVKENDS